MEFNKSKWQILHLGWGDCVCMYRQGGETLGNSPAGRDLGVLADGKLNMSQLCALAARRTSRVLRCFRHSTA